MSPQAKNIHLAEPLLSQLEAAARSQQKTPDELAGEAVQAYLDRQWQELIEYGHRKGQESGHLEEDVPELIHQFRRQHRQRST